MSVLAKNESLPKQAQASMVWQLQLFVHLKGVECIVYMGEKDIERQAPNVARMKMLGATVIPATSGSKTLKDATNEAIRDWINNPHGHALYHRKCGWPASLSRYGGAISKCDQRGNTMAA